ncbi:MAG: hydrogenase iron-sulfur subunit, partial [Candidatus Riflebacteria bacterium]|nr:hydrogenase iron-sulfur subunit [Candidatus Riflebacteria bacterium]
CTGRVEPELVLQAFARAADGVLFCGCHPGDCHYVSGNCRAYSRFTLLSKILASMGVEPERFQLRWISASEAPQVAAVTVAMTEALKTLGLWRRTGAPADPVQGGLRRD